MSDSQSHFVVLLLKIDSAPQQLDDDEAVRKCLVSACFLNSAQILPAVSGLDDDNLEGQSPQV